jgi:D-amino peptidase
MKLLIACDMEGISGVVNWDQVDPSNPEYKRFCKIMTADVNAAIQGAASAGVTEILVTDGHWNSTNLLLEELDPRARLNSGSPNELSMVQGVDSGIDVAIMIGYHARVGSLKAILDHTWSSIRIANVWLNGRLVGEFGLNSAVCGHFNVPVLMVSGDQTVCAEAKEWVPGVEGVVVKQASGRFAAECLPLSVSQQRIRDTAAKAVQRYQAGMAPAPLKVKAPVKVEIEFVSTQMADMVVMLPGAQRIDGRKLSYEAVDMLKAYLAFRAMVALAQVR